FVAEAQIFFAALEAFELRLARGDRLLRVTQVLAELDDDLVGVFARRGQVGELRLFGRHRGGNAFFALLEDGNIGGDRVALEAERGRLLADLFELALGLRFAAAETFDAVLRALDRGFFGADFVVGRERGGVRLLERGFCGLRFEAR